MTGDELAAKLYREQGYLILASSMKQKIGDIVKESSLLSRRHDNSIDCHRRCRAGGF